MRKGLDDDLVDQVLSELDKRIDGVRFIWKRGDEIVALNQENTDDMKLIWKRIWKRMVAHRVTWVEKQEEKKRREMMMRLVIEKEIGQFPSISENSATTQKKKSSTGKIRRPAKAGKVRVKHKRPGHPKKKCS